MAPPVFGPDEIDQFISTLQPADVLIFDKFGLPGGLVQWADECPANHVALVTRDGKAIEANKTVPAVKEVDIDSYLCNLAIRTTTVFRHTALADGNSPMIDAVISRAMQDKDRTHYAYLDVTPVGLLAADRMYGQELRDQLRWTFAPIMNLIAHQVRGCVQPNTATLTCSEFVYRCFTEAVGGLPIEILDPLLTYGSDDGVRGIGPLGRYLSYVDPAGPELERPSQVQELWGDILAHDVNRKIKPTGNPGDPVPDAVSPGDLWRSSSLTPIAALHRPPERPWTRPGH